MENLINEMRDFDVNSACLELITKRDGIEFYKALYGDFVVIMIKSDDYRNGYINATKLCADGHKPLSNWMRLQSSLRLMSDFEQFFRPSFQNVGNYSIKHVVITSNRNERDCMISGTYFHSDVIVHIASWVSTHFAFKVSRIVNSFISSHFQKVYADEMERFRQEVKPLAAPYTDNYQLHNCFLILRKNIPNVLYPYYTLRVQRRNLKNILKKVKYKYPNSEIIYRKDQDPNSVKLFRLMQEKLPIKSKGNGFNCQLSEVELLTSVDELYNRLLGF